jgi:hypothetical protein
MVFLFGLCGSFLYINSAQKNTQTSYEKFFQSFHNQYSDIKTWIINHKKLTFILYEASWKVAEIGILYREFKKYSLLTGNETKSFWDYCKEKGIHGWEAIKKSYDKGTMFNDATDLMTHSMFEAYETVAGYVPGTDLRKSRIEKQAGQKAQEAPTLTKNLLDTKWNNGEQRKIFIEGKELSFSSRDALEKYLKNYSIYNVAQLKKTNEAHFEG